MFCLWLTSGSWSLAVITCVFVLLGLSVFSSIEGESNMYVCRAFAQHTVLAHACSKRPLQDVPGHLGRCALGLCVLSSSWLFTHSVLCRLSLTLLGFLQAYLSCGPFPHHPWPALRCSCSPFSGPLCNFVRAVCPQVLAVRKDLMGMGQWLGPASSGVFCLLCCCVFCGDLMSSTLSWGGFGSYQWRGTEWQGDIVEGPSLWT